MAIATIDLRHLGVAKAICCFVDRSEGWLVDPGPQSTIPALLNALGDWQPDRILLTHIHLDHAGATGKLLSLWPGTEVWVHERGARHLVAPARLEAGARQVYGEEFDRLWGGLEPVPETRVRALAGGERLEGWEVAYTPGHAKHHVSYLHEATGTAFCGDVAGVRILDGPVLAPTPPPDIDLVAWSSSLDTIESWAPTTLACTHFGLYDDAKRHLAAMRTEIDQSGERFRRVDAAAFAACAREQVLRRTDSPIAHAAYERANPPELLWDGLARWFDARAADGGPRAA